MAGKVEDRVVGKVEDRVVGKVEDRVVGKGVVESGVVARELSGQCGMEEGMEQGVGVEVVEGLGECGGQIHAGAIQSRKEEEKAWVLEEGLEDWRGTRDGAECGQSGMGVGREPVGVVVGEEVLGGSDDGSGLSGFVFA